MYWKRIAALAAAPLTLLSGSAVYAASNTDAPPSIAPVVVNSTCNAPAGEKVLTVEEGIAIVEKCSAPGIAAVGWHWMGNYGSVYDVAAVANSAGVGPGELIAIPQPSGSLVPAFMYY